MGYIGPLLRLPATASRYLGRLVSQRPRPGPGLEIDRQAAGDLGERVLVGPTLSCKICSSLGIGQVPLLQWLLMV